ncbi:MAG: aldo/keto reductase [Pseudomonadota bacterium]|nr:aldo/keto reductase [Pseudomonadota bacterium]
MDYRRIGTSGLVASRICLGGNSWGAEGRRAWGAFGAEAASGFFREALDAGVTWFDTADTYNAGDSEAVMGETLLKMVPREELVIGSKVGIPLSDRPNHGGLGRKHLMASIDGCLKRLGTDYVDIYHIHRLDEGTPLEETLEAFGDMIRAGKVRYLGVSTMPVRRMARILALAEFAGAPKPIVMQNLYNLVTREEEAEMIPLCAEAGVDCSPYSPLARGLLSGARTRGGEAATERAANDANAGRPRDADWDVVEALVEVAQARGAKPSQVALAWMLSKPFLAAPVIGVTRPGHVSDAAAATAIRLTQEEVARLEAPYAFRPVK